MPGISDLKRIKRLAKPALTGKPRGHRVGPPQTEFGPPRSERGIRETLKNDVVRNRFLLEKGLPQVSSTEKDAARPTLVHKQRIHGKFSPDRVKIILWALLRGNYRITAAQLAGITYESFRNWMELGENEESGPYRDFHDAVMKAESESEAAILEQVHVQVPDDWRAGMEILKRRHPDRWGRETKEIVGKQGGPILIRVEYEEPNDDSDSPRQAELA